MSVDGRVERHVLLELLVLSDDFGVLPLHVLEPPSEEGAVHALYAGRSEHACREGAARPSSRSARSANCIVDSVVAKWLTDVLIVAISVVNELPPRESQRRCVSFELR